LLAFTLQCWGAMLLQRNGPGDRDRARELLTRATSTAERFGMLELARRAEQLAASAGLSGDPSQKPATEQ
jgi:hypothetical protein